MASFTEPDDEEEPGNVELVGVAWAAKILKVFFRIGALAKLKVSVRCWKFRYGKVHVFT